MHNIKEFRDFLCSATDVQILKAINFINMAGFNDGTNGTHYLYEDVITGAIEFAKSECNYAVYFLNSLKKSKSE